MDGVLGSMPANNASRLILALDVEDHSPGQAMSKHATPQAVVGLIFGLGPQLNLNLKLI